MMDRQLIAQQRMLAAAIAADGPSIGLKQGAAALQTAGLDVYRNAYRARLIEALRSNYPVLHRVLGDEEFEHLGLAYLSSSPSRKPSIRWFGDGLVNYMFGQPDAVAHASLIDLARMEWSLGASFDAADHRVMTADDLLTVPAPAWPSLQFQAHPSVSLLDLDWAIEPLWSAVTSDESAQTEAPQALRHSLLVWRKGLDTRWRSVPDDEAMALRMCLNGMSFERLCSEAARFDDVGAAVRVAGWLRGWVDEGLFSNEQESRCRAT